MNYRVGIVGVSGYGGGEAVRYVAAHPRLDLVYAGGDSSAGARLAERFPTLPAPLADLTIKKWDPTALPDLDVLIASLPTGQSRNALARVDAGVKIVDIGGDHRFVEGWTYGLADVWPDRIAESTRVANPGCYPAAAITALAPLLAAKLIDPATIIVDAKSGVSGAGRGGGTTLGFADVDEDLSPYKPTGHGHLPEIVKALSEVSRGAGADQIRSLTFVPHLVPMVRGICCTCYAAGTASTQDCLESAKVFYAEHPLVHVLDAPPHTKHALGTNRALVSYAADPDAGRVIAFGVVDNLGKGAAGQAVQNVNLMLGLPATLGVDQPGLWP